MKIAVTSTGNSIDSKFSEQFGRCPYFIIFDTDYNKNVPLLNEAKDLQGGAGPKATELLVKNSVETLLTGRLGDKAEKALKKSGIKTITGFPGNLKVKDIIDEFLVKMQ